MIKEILFSGSSARLKEIIDLRGTNYTAYTPTITTTDWDFIVVSVGWVGKAIVGTTAQNLACENAQFYHTLFPNSSINFGIPNFYSMTASSYVPMSMTITTTTNTISRTAFTDKNTWNSFFGLNVATCGGGYLHAYVFKY